jgi:ubiquinone/menaquinone biosynthesis C-methylase UbiE
MIERYMSNSEYETHFGKLLGLRSRIARKLPIKPHMRILDVATGEGFFALEVVRLHGDVKITGIDISQSSIRDARRNVRKQNLRELIEIVEMDATNMWFSEQEFDMAINFTGLEDIHMTRGKSGVQQTFFEVNRVLKPDSLFCFVVMPPDEMETSAQKIEATLFSYICGATWLNSKEYEKMLEKAKFKLCKKRRYYSFVKFTPQQAKNEIKYTIRRVPKIYGINTPTFEEIWSKFGQDIEENGLGCYSKVVLMVARKVEDANIK